MNRRLRAAVIPFFMALFPAVWYIDRNVLSEQLYPHVEPTAGLIGLAVGAAIVGSAAFAAVLALFRSKTVDDERELPYRQRVLQPDSTALVVFFGFIVVTLGWALVEVAEIGPSQLGDALSVLLIPLSIPLLVLAPFTIRYHWALILGLVLCVLWMSLLATVSSDVIRRRSLPATDE
ncbi:hypothetical protein [Halosolutus gelatinilyticus]|uniref:hypothetical protein n=1 Tax=Halosolutus gelatinilyticus TaxID=2931975 RepID=UPI001FF334B6|nr:hypothetical protein [Halosolutus gelatinilyticus]